MGKDNIYQHMYDRAIRYEETELTDLPEKNYNLITLEPSEELVQEYKNTIIDALDDEGFDPKSLAVKLHTITGGFIKKDDGEILLISDNPKLDMLQDILESNINRTKIIIFHHYVEEGRLLETFLTKLKIRYATLRGETKNKEKEFTEFTTNDKVRVLVAHVASAGEGYTFTQATIEVFYSNNHSLRYRKQAEKRIHRDGQKNPVYYYDLVYDGMMDHKVYEAMLENKNMFDLFVNTSREEIRSLLYY
jgi:SNF2 family DNA or RNA helicase